MPYCQKCGEKIPEGSVYCQVCGQKQKLKKEAIGEFVTAAEEIPILHKVNYSLVGWGIGSFVIVLYFLISRKPDGAIRLMSFIPFWIILCLLSLVCGVSHLVVRKKETYSYKKKVGAILLIIIVISLGIFVTGTTYGQVVMLSAGRSAFEPDRVCYDKQVATSDCEAMEGYEDLGQGKTLGSAQCKHYEWRGLGKCDKCVREECTPR
jgi:hypothetical protein